MVSRNLFIISAHPVLIPTQLTKLVLLTEVRETNKGNQYIQTQLSKWVSFVNKKNPSNCTSDVNNYKDEKMAKQELGLVKEMFNDTSKYVVDVVKF